MSAADGAGQPRARRRTALVQDPSLLQAYSVIKTVKDMMVDAGNGSTISALKVLMIVVCGTQSSGKTSFIEALIGFPVGHTDRGTATRCPVRYILRSGPSAYLVNKLDVRNREGVRNAVKQHMQALGAKIVADVLLVEIMEPEMIDLDITDLPGLKTRDEPDYKPIADIAKGFLHDRSVLPVVMCKASDSHQTQHDLDSMRDLGLDVNRSLVVMNYFNKQIADMSHISDLNRYCQGQRGKYPMVRFVMLHYKDGINKDRMSFDQLSQYYSNFPEDEEDAFDDKLKRMEADAHLDPNIRQNFGVISVFGYMQRSLHEWMKKNEAAVRTWLQEQHSMTKGRLTELKEALKQQDPKSVAQMWRDYIIDFERIMAAVHSATLTNVKRLERGAKFAPKYQWAFTMDEVGVTTTYDDERALVASAPPEHWLSSEQLREELPGTYTSSILDDNLSPHAAYTRLMLVTAYMMMALPMRPFTKDEIRSKSEHSRDAITHSFNKHTVVKQLVTERLFHLQDILSEMMTHIQALYEAPLPKIHEALRANYPVVCHHNEFINELDNKFKTLLTGYLEKAESSMHDVIEERTRFFGVDLPNRLLMLLGLTPLRQDILVDNPNAAYAQEEDDEQQSGTSNSSGDVLGAIAKGAKEVVTDPAGIVKAGMNLVTDVLKGVPTVLPRERNPDVPERVDNQREAVLKVKRALHKYHSLFRLVDFSEGGLQDLSMDEYRCPQVEEINKDGEQYFLILKGLITLDVEAKLDRNVYEPLKNKLLLEAMTKQMLMIVDEIVEDSDRLARITGGNAAKLEDEVRNEEEKERMIADALDKLKSVDGGLGAAGVPPQLQAPHQLPNSQTFASGVCVNGCASLAQMSLSSLPQSFRNNFKKAAAKDLSEAFAHPEHKIRIRELHEGSILVDFTLQLRSEADVPATTVAMTHAAKRGLCLVKAGRVYCQALGADATLAKDYGKATLRDFPMEHHAAAEAGSLVPLGPAMPPAERRVPPPSANVPNDTRSDAWHSGSSQPGASSQVGLGAPSPVRDGQGFEPRAAPGNAAWDGREAMYAEQRSQQQSGQAEAEESTHSTRAPDPMPPPQHVVQTQQMEMVLRQMEEMRQEIQRLTEDKERLQQEKASAAGQRELPSSASVGQPQAQPRPQSGVLSDAQNEEDKEEEEQKQEDEEKAEEEEEQKQEDGEKAKEAEEKKQGEEEKAKEEMAEAGGESDFEFR